MAVSCCQAPVPLQNERHPVRIEDVYVGGILWIRRQSSISSQFPDLALDPGSYNHPAIVIRLKKQDVSEPLVTIAPMTSFGCRDLKESHPKDRSFWMRYLPLAPSLPHPSSGIQLLLKHGAVLEKPSYIQRTCYEVSPGVLAHYSRDTGYLARAKELRLTKGLLKQLLLHMSDPVPWRVNSTFQVPPTPSMSSSATVKSNEWNDTSRAKSREDISAKEVIIFDIRLSIKEHHFDDGTFEQLLRLCESSNIDKLVTPQMGSSVLTSTSHLVPVLGQPAILNPSKSVMDIQQTPVGNVGPESPASPVSDIAGGKTLDDLRGDQVKASTESLLKTHRMFSDLVLAHRYATVLYSTTPLFIYMALRFLRRKPVLAWLGYFKYLAIKT